MTELRIQCPECRGAKRIGPGWKCPTCRGDGTIPDRRRPTANDRAIERIKDAMVGVNCQHCQLFVDAVRRIINEEAECKETTE